ncbi:death-inducer obliterator 1-like [Olea europaea subsp. europaea]|uniref:Death-inducer obliterator 1-like n=1 Tax=Olea europaea subsp. europaea TaxID=158383 RepID=A0A8S0QCZ0_OLEEU|nr:death-inducer obliterator 1-like [Olea europaea subsp. europaea]
MSNNLVSLFPLQNRQVVLMEHVSTSLDLLTSEMNMRMVGQVPNNDLSHHLALSNEQMGVAEPMCSNLGFQNVFLPNNRVGQNELDVGINGSNAFRMPNKQGHDGRVMQNIQAGEKSILPSKREGEGGPGQYDFVPQQSLMPNKRAKHMGANINSPGLTQLTPQKKTVPMKSKLYSPGLQNQPLLNEKLVRNEPMSSKFGGPRGQNSKRQTSLIDTGSKVQTESAEAVRSKMRESLADALSLAFRKQDKDANSKKKQTDTANINQTPEECQSSESNLTTATPVPGSEDISSSKELDTAGKPRDSQVLSAEFPTHESSGNGVQAFGEFHYGTILPDEEVSFSKNFFVKDDLLLGNGLSWALDFDVEVREGKEAQNSETAESLKEDAQGAGDRVELATLTPINLAFKIEAELFKVFGGVNKKYKEKGRSLLFNLKDRKNPELRERVMSGEISPESLCSMSAEELASKELSEWRMAKAEELAQMVVLPDTDMRRLVKKTHKGEYQVEVERDYSMAAEVSGWTTVSTQLKSEEETETHFPSKADNIKARENVADQEKIAETQDSPGRLVIPTDGTDLMQGMMVDDEMKDADFLPPIVSLDEFMEFLNSEPPFDNIPAEADKTTPISHKESPEEIKNSKASNSAAENSKNTPSKKEEGSVGELKVDVAVRSDSGSAVQKGLPSGDASEAECLWEGALQLNISSLVTVSGQFQSGEKTSTKEWPSSLEIKGRVRLDAFEKFFRELPMSRTRAVMVHEGLLFFISLGFSSQTIQCSLPLSMKLPLGLVPVRMYNSSCNRKFLKMINCWTCFLLLEF